MRLRLAQPILIAVVAVGILAGVTLQRGALAGPAPVGASPTIEAVAVVTGDTRDPAPARRAARGVRVHGTFATTQWRLAGAGHRNGGTAAVARSAHRLVVLIERVHAGTARRGA
jgi:hypothetical protein